MELIRKYKLYRLGIKQTALIQRTFETLDYNISKLKKYTHKNHELSTFYIFGELSIYKNQCGIHIVNHHILAHSSIYHFIKEELCCTHEENSFVLKDSIRKKMRLKKGDYTLYNGIFISGTIENLYYEECIKPSALPDSPL